MSTIEFVDQTLRDGQQSLWGMRMRAGHALPVAAAIDRVGYAVVDVTGSSQFEVQVRHHHDNPWEGLDLLRAAMPTATLRAGTRSNGIVGMGLTPYCMLDLWVTTLAKHGIDSFWIFDCLFNIHEMERMVGTVRNAGSTASPQVMFGTSPVHTDAYFADKVAKLAATTPTSTPARSTPSARTSPASPGPRATRSARPASTRSPSSTSSCPVG